MADSLATTGELYKAKTITKDDVAVAVEAFMDDLITTAFLFGDGYQIDLAEAVQPHEWTSVTVGTKDATDHLKRAAVRTAILLATERLNGMRAVEAEAASLGSDITGALSPTLRSAQDVRSPVVMGWRNELPAIALALRTDVTSVERLKPRTAFAPAESNRG